MVTLYEYFLMIHTQLQKILWKNNVISISHFYTNRMKKKIGLFIVFYLRMIVFRSVRNVDDNTNVGYGCHDQFRMPSSKLLLN